MDNIYTEYNFTISPKEPGTEILIAELGSIGFESFVENETGVVAYIQNNDWNENMLDDIFVLNSKEFDIEYSHKEIEQTNWNAEWEKNFKPIRVENKVSVRAPFHENPNLEFDIVIEPKMSFGTGHHETTYMMLQHLLDLDVSDKKVLDMGCGTGILAIFVEMKGAKPIDAIDIDTWCYTNSLENVERNNCNNISVFEGDSLLLKDRKYDLIIANINRNILLNDMAVYTDCLKENGTLLLSGFYQEDISIIDDEVKKHKLLLIKTIERNNWVALRYQK
ncbi:[LSU ribosomal protein L11P]-lysine N-methyltransferase [Tenacibaculum sp. MAR_2009_124]|uniref:50S ribosomal protein L11 methyltransferase n=1 Tax=Tenacibaculum sp. MAR_2009_124 TaxID=1250059 RepID=UPI00089A24B4|nr:50S ribosomal protein L11 methyltransferase [Tenacibaculum sp. MAR_2009_124]SEB77559.1 [LSU ribosomal protein L11P]-lysine N-methyltransferase [Tenacibaculum sp. MAR_2009_124]